jgi:hypothetical protein
LTQTDPSGKLELIKVQLSDVLVSAFQLTGDTANPSPGESAAFSFGKICVTHSSGVRFGWDMKTINSAGGC